MKMKWFMFVLLAITCLAFVPCWAFADVTIEEGASGIPQSVVDDIVSDADGEHVTIHEWGVVEAAEPRIIIGPIVTTGFRVTSKVKTEHQAIGKDEFIISVARGMSISLTSSKTYKLDCSISGTPSSAELGITASISHTYTINVVWNGPGENSPYNTRSYRIRFFEDRGTYEGYHTFMDGILWDQKETGVWEEPVSYALYSIDSYIEPLE